MKVILFGAGKSAEEYLDNKNNNSIVAVADNQGRGISGISSISPADIDRIDYDVIVITPTRSRWEILNQLLMIEGIDYRKIQYFCPSFSIYKEIKIMEDGDGLLYLLAVQKDGVAYIWRNEVDERVATYPIINGEYNYGCQYKHQTVIDIGMNVGIASLWFAANEYVDRVISFEPFKAPYLQAIKNFELNESIGKKIESYNFGLGYEDKHVKGIFFAGHSTASRTTDAMNDTDEWESTDCEVEIRDAGLMLKSLLEKDENSTVMKMNCEGAEYDILRSLFEQDVLKKFNVMMIETHDGNEKEAISILDKAGFVYFWDQKELGQGFLRAVRV